MCSMTVVIPVKNPCSLREFINLNKRLLESYPVVVVDSGGGEPLKPFCWKYFQVEVSMWEARKICYKEVQTPLTMNLDCDTIIPEKYVRDAVEILQKGCAHAIAIDYEDLMGHLSFGASIWVTELLRKLYNYPPKAIELTVKESPGKYSVFKGYGFCECTWMWRRLNSNGYKLETLPYRAKHLK